MTRTVALMDETQWFNGPSDRQLTSN